MINIISIIFLSFQQHSGQDIWIDDIYLCGLIGDELIIDRFRSDDKRRTQTYLAGIREGLKIITDLFGDDTWEGIVSCEFIGIVSDRTDGGCYAVAALSP